MEGPKAKEYWAQGKIDQGVFAKEKFSQWEFSLKELFPKENSSTENF